MKRAKEQQIMFKKLCSKEKGFTLLELVATIGIFVITISMLFSIFLVVYKFVVMFAAKNDTLQAVNTFSTRLERYLAGANTVFTLKNKQYIAWDNWINGEVIDNIYFCTKYINTDGTDENAAVRIKVKNVYDEKTKKQLYFRDKLSNNQCRPLRKIIVDIYPLPVNTCIKLASEWEALDKSRAWDNATHLFFAPVLVSAKSSFSYLVFHYKKMELKNSLGTVLVTWPFLEMQATFGVLHAIYDDKRCTHKVRGYGVDIYPYRHEFTIYGHNVER